MKLIERTGLLLPNGFSIGVNDPIQALELGRGNCIAGALVTVAAHTLEDEQIKVVRHTQMLEDNFGNLLQSLNHYFCSTSLETIIHMVTSMREEDFWKHTGSSSFDEAHADRLAAFYLDSIEKLGVSRTMATLDSLHKRRQISDRFAWINPDLLLAHVAPGKTIGMLAEAASDALDDKMAAMV